MFWLSHFASPLVRNWLKIVCRNSALESLTAMESQSRLTDGQVCTERFQAFESRHQASQIDLRQPFGLSAGLSLVEDRLQ